MPSLSLNTLDPHPDNANRMTGAALEKLIAHLRNTGEYPPLIVRRHPTIDGRFQVLDGHHRAAALRRLGHEHARCEVWEVDDDRAAMLLLTLNRLHGEDDPQRRGALLERLTNTVPLDRLARLLPEDLSRLKRLINLNHPPPLPPAPPPDFKHIPQPITFFLTTDQRTRLLDHLHHICQDRTQALIRLLALDQT